MTNADPPGRDTVEPHQAGTMNPQLDSLRSALTSSDDAWFPFVDIEDSADAWVLEADLSLITHSKINIELSEAELAITGAVNKRKRRRLLTRRTRRARRFEYRLALPGGAASEHIDASLNLIVRIPKPEPAERGADPEQDQARKDWRSSDCARRPQAEGAAPPGDKPPDQSASKN